MNPRLDIEQGVQVRSFSFTLSQAYIDRQNPGGPYLTLVGIVREREHGTPFTTHYTRSFTELGMVDGQFDGLQLADAVRKLLSFAVTHEVDQCLMVDDIAHTVPGFFFEYGRRMVKIRQRRLPITC